MVDFRAKFGTTVTSMLKQFQNTVTAFKAKQPTVMRYVYKSQLSYIVHLLLMK